eukprot:CAMPEP_0184742008 /NCGR_PEP_ID=MMETSP0315-20130426/5011_1 /TAXON_ID=101924 /ORGANISM="Rhodosorus marinus, Strain UTEX LB 2760" /LENGTH=500 /DNA_ID=CAMNT_0027212639 /DNA_START=259 /DNA_END=1761 /DNA_ORIENTATION=+
MSTLENNQAIDFKANDAFSRAKGAVRTKVICHLGPKTKDPESISELVESGMNVACLNFAQGNTQQHLEIVQNLRMYLAATKRMCAILVDTRGAKARTGKLKNSQPVKLKGGSTVRIMPDLDFLGDETAFGVSYSNLSQVMAPGRDILIDDGLVHLVVTEINGKNVDCTVVADAVLGEQKGVNLPGIRTDMPTLTAKDEQDLILSCEQKVDIVAASFIRKAEDAKKVRQFLDTHGGSNIKMFSKIENQEGLENFDEILSLSDGILVARGDLGIEIPTEKVTIAQKMMIAKCNIAGKPVVTATQMLDSMIINPRPTRAETTDVANAVFDGSDCVMLSGETAQGDFAPEAVRTMVSICREAERWIDYNFVHSSLRHFLRKRTLDVTETICSSSVKTSYDLGASLILCLTETGNTAREICKYRPIAPVICVSANEGTARQLLVHRGLFPLVVGSMLGTESLIARSLAAATRSGLCKKGDLVVVISGMREGVSGTTNVLRVLTVE